MGREIANKRLALVIAMLALEAGMLTIAPVAAAESVRMQTLLNADGSGRLFVNTGMGEPWSWEVCSPDPTSCAAFGTGGEITTAGASPETVFRVSGNSAAGLIPGLSPIWHGNVTSLTRPSVTGPVRGNELVTPAPGQWQGGWEGEGDFLQLAACPTRQATSCTTLTDSHYPRSCPNSSAVLDPAFVGEYLRVADQRRGAGPHPELLYASGSPYGARGGVWEPSPTTSVAVVGRITPPTGPRAVKCGPPPLVRASISNTGVATVRCELTCRAVMIVRLGSRIARVARDVPRFALRPPQGTAIRKLRLSARALAYLGRGRARFTLKVDGRQVAQRTVLLR